MVRTAALLGLCCRCYRDGLLLQQQAAKRNAHFPVLLEVSGRSL